MKELIISEKYLGDKKYTDIKIIYETDKFIKFEYVNSGCKEVITQEEFKSKYTIEEELKKPDKSASVRDSLSNPAKEQWTKEEEEKLIEDCKKTFESYMNGYIKGKREAEKEYGKILNEIYTEAKKLFNPEMTTHQLLVFIKGKMPPKESDVHVNPFANTNSFAYNPTSEITATKDEEPDVLKYFAVPGDSQKCSWKTPAYELDEFPKEGKKFPLRLGNYEGNILLWYHRDANSVRVGFEAKKEESKEERIVNELSQQHSTMRGQNPKDKKPREYLVQIDSDNNVKYMKLLKEGEKPNGDYKNYLPEGVIRVREVME